MFGKKKPDNANGQNNPPSEGKQDDEQPGLVEEKVISPAPATPPVMPEATPAATEPVAPAQQPVVTPVEPVMESTEQSKPETVATTLPESMPAPEAPASVEATPAPVEPASATIVKPISTPEVTEKPVEAVKEVVKIEPESITPVATAEPVVPTEQPAKPIEKPIVAEAKTATVAETVEPTEVTQPAPAYESTQPQSVDQSNTNLANLDALGVVQTSNPFPAGTEGTMQAPTAPQPAMQPRATETPPAGVITQTTATITQTTTPAPPPLESAPNLNSMVTPKKKGGMAGVVILLLVLLLAAFAGILGFLVYQDTKISAKNVSVTNLTDTAMTVTWVSEEPYLGRIKYKEAGSDWKPLFAMTEGEIAYDDRDVDLNAKGEYYTKSGGGQTRHTHHVTVRNLKPETEYSLRIVGTINGKDLGLKIKTKKIIEDIRTPDPAYGKIEGIDAGDSFVIVNPASANEDEDIATFSVPVSDKSTYSFDIANFGKDKKAKDVIVFVYSGKDKSAKAQFTEDTYKPLKTIVVGASSNSTSQVETNPNVLGQSLPVVKPTAAICSGVTCIQDGQNVGCDPGSAANDGKVDCTCANGSKTITDVPVNGGIATISGSQCTSAIPDDGGPSDGGGGGGDQNNGGNTGGGGTNGGWYSSTGTCNAGFYYCSCSQHGTGKGRCATASEIVNVGGNQTCVSYCNAVYGGGGGDGGDGEAPPADAETEAPADPQEPEPKSAYCVDGQTMDLTAEEARVRRQVGGYTVTSGACPAASPQTEDTCESNNGISYSGGTIAPSARECRRRGAAYVECVTSGRTVIVSDVFGLGKLYTCDAVDTAVDEDIWDDIFGNGEQPEEDNDEPQNEEDDFLSDLTQIPNSPIKDVKAESPRSDGAVLGASDGVEVDGAGKYVFFADGQKVAEQEIIVGGDSIQIKMFNDANGNGKHDDGEEYLEDYSQITLSKEGSVETYDLIPGWNLVNLPLLDTSSSNPVQTAGALIDKWNSQGADIKHIARYRNGKFEVFSKRESGTQYSPDFDLVPGQGMFILNLGDTAQVSYSGKAVEGSAPVKLSNGWNLVGFVSGNSYNSEQLLKKVGESGIKASTLSQFENGLYQSVIVDEGTLFGNNFNVINKRGYFIKVDEGGDKTFTP